MRFGAEFYFFESHGAVRRGFKFMTILQCGAVLLKAKSCGAVRFGRYAIITAPSRTVKCRATTGHALYIACLIYSLSFFYFCTKASSNSTVGVVPYFLSS